MGWATSEILTPMTYSVNCSEGVAAGSEEPVAWKIYSAHSHKAQVVPGEVAEVAEEAAEVDSQEGSPVVSLVASHLCKVVHQEVSLGLQVEEAGAEQIPSQVLVCE